ncbi:MULTISPECIES: lipopolysaccharide biosynthesis protein [unclassified Ruegeria]|uniref:lipopolysaccharide biosynthesis protein n=1 Tax=unclassified Ruegeria TaxID=2625375 RepID=UPI00148941C5|nr:MULTISPECIES: oligosaccharide flippase family protein [unclassified Ruegeria]
MSVSVDLRKFILSVGPTGASAVLQLFVFALTARSLGPEQFGLLAVLYAVSVVSAEVAGLGADSALLKSVSVQPTMFRRAWGQFLLVFGVSVVPLALVAASLSYFFANSSVMWIVALALILGEITIGRVTAATELVFVSQDRPVQASLIRLFVVSCRALAAIIAFVLLGWNTVGGWSLVTLLQSLVCSCLLIGIVTRTFGRPQIYLIRGDIVFGCLMMLNQLARSLNTNLDRIVLSAFLSSAQIGVYASGTRLLQVNGILNQAATRIFYARFFRAGEQGSDALSEYTLATGKKMAWVGVLGAVIMIVLAPFLPFVLGEGYEQSKWVAVCLALISPVISLQYPPADALTASNRQLLRTIIYFSMALVSGGLIAIGAFVGGIFGALAGMALSQFVLCITLWYMVRFVKT